MTRKFILLFFATFLTLCVKAQSVDSTDKDKEEPEDTATEKVDTPKAKKHLPLSITGTMGVSYEYYGLNVDPGTYTGVPQRKPWNQLRFSFQPTFKLGNDWSLPVNINFSAFPTNNAAGPYAGLKTQNFGQWLTNPSNNIGFSPKYKWAQLLLGTQYIKYSDLSTGDIGAFGAGFDLRPKTYLIKFFAGISQYGVDYVAPPPLPGIPGSYKRTHYMFQLGKEKEGKYLFALNFSKGKDDINSVTSTPVTVTPQEGFVASVISEVHFLKKWYVKLEAAQSYFTTDLTQPIDILGSGTTLEPFIGGHTSTKKDNAGTLSFGRKSKDFDIGYTTKYIGEYFQTTGYPYMQPDHWDNTLDTRFSVWKHKMNVSGSVGLRTNNINEPTLKSNQFIGNVNWFTQFNQHLGLNLNYNNFGFRSVGSTLNPYGIKNVSNDFGVSPTYTWTTSKMMNIITMSYNYSKYDERDVITGITTSNNTHTGLASYIPTFFKSNITPELSALYFVNTAPAVKTTLTTFTGGAGYPLLKKKIQLHAQLQYTIGQLNAYTSNNNIIASLTVDYKITKKLTWKNYFSTNHFRYGNELTPPAYLNGVQYLETNIRTSLQYKF